MKRSSDLIHGSIIRSIVLFSIPLLLGNLFQQLYNTVDSYVVGNYVSMYALGAVGQSGTIINTLISFFMGLSVGAGVVIAQHYGSNSYDKLKKAIHTSLALTVVLCVFCTIIGYFLSTPILSLIGSPKEVLNEASIYLKIYFLGVSFMMIYNMGSGILRALGNSKNPLYYLMISSITNILLDLLFVIKFNMGVSGVAYATLISQAISAFLVLRELILTDNVYKVYIDEIRFDKETLKEIIKVGFPAALQNAIVSFSNTLVQSYISKFGPSGVAGFSTTVKLDGFLQLPIQSFAMAITTFVGQNYGAKDYKRIKKGILCTLVMCLVVTVIGSYIFYNNSIFLLSLFTDDLSAIEAGNKMMKVFALGYVFIAVGQVLAGALRGIGLSNLPMINMIFSFVILRQVWLYFSYQYNPDIINVFLGWPLTWVVNAIIMVYFYFRSIKKLTH